MNEIAIPQLIDIGKKSWIDQMMVWASHFLARPLIQSLKTHCRGKTADIGGDDFFSVARDLKLNFTSWTTIDISTRSLELKKRFGDSRFDVIVGDGCNLSGIVADGTFDTVMNSQVLEHVMEPEKMVSECARILKPGGTAIFYLPQSSVLHMAPHHYFNFTRYWIENAVKNAGLEILECRPVGGTWASHGSHLIFFFLQVLRKPHLVPSDVKRNAFFYILLPIMLIYALVAFPLMMLFSLGDLKEGANNHLVVTKKPVNPTR